MKRTVQLLATVLVALGLVGGVSASSTANVLKIGGVVCNKATEAAGGSIACRKADFTGYIVGIANGWVLVEKQGSNRVIFKRYRATGPPDGLLPVNANRMYSPAAEAFCQKDFANSGVACIQADASGFGFAITRDLVLVYDNDASRVVWKHSQ